MTIKDNLVIIEKYENFFFYIYPIVQNINRSDGYIKQKFIDILCEQVGYLYRAVKSNQVSRLYEADERMATIRFFLRLFSSKNVKKISLNQAGNAEKLLSEVGGILNSMIKSRSSK